MSKNMLIIGNGFDLGHGFPTSYIQFLKFAYYFEIIYSASRGENFNTLPFEAKDEAGNPIAKEDQILTNELNELMKKRKITRTTDELSRYDGPQYSHLSLISCTKT